MLEQRLEVGTKIYYVREENCAFSRKKIKMIDDNGVEWHRYDKPLRIQEMIECTVVGRVLMSIEGHIRSHEDYLDMYFLDNGHNIDENDINENYPIDSFAYFTLKEDADRWIESRKVEASKFD